MLEERVEPKKEAWVKPEILSLDVGETHRFTTRGGDAGPYSTAMRS